MRSVADHLRRGNEMMQKRTRRMALLACASLASLGLLFGVSPAAAKGTKTITKTLSQCQGQVLPLNDNSSLQVPFTVPRVPKRAKPAGARVVSVASVGLRIGHTFDRDVTAFLVSPTGLVDPLVLGRGDTGDNFGTGATDCGGSLTSFSDSAVTPIGSGAAPFPGAFKPEAPLSVFANSRAAGIWRVIVSDSAPGDTGTLYAVSLRLTYRYKSQR